MYKITEDKKFNKIKNKILNNEEMFVNDNFHTKYNVEKNVIILNEETILDDINILFKLATENEKEDDLINLIDEFIFSTKKELRKK